MVFNVEKPKDQLVHTDECSVRSNAGNVIYGPPSGNDIPKLARRAAGWSIFLTAVRQILTIGTTMVVSRHVTPSEFGVAAMALTFLAFLVLFDTALTWATVQAPIYDKEKFDALFFFGFLFGVGLLGLSVIAGPLLAAFYNAPKLIWLSVFIGAAAFLNSLATQPAALLRRRLQQKKLNTIDTAALCVSCAVGIGLALGGAGVWAVVSQAVCMHAVRSIAVLALSEAIPGWPRKFSVALPELRKGAGFALSNYVCYFQLYLGGILAARCFGSLAMGNYQRAYGVKSMPTQYASMVVTDVMVSSLAALRSEPEKLALLYRKALIITSVIGCPAGAFLFSGGAEVIRLLYGPQWQGAARLLQWFALAAMTLPISTSTIWLFLAAGKAREQLWMNIGLTGISLVALLSTAKFARDLETLVLVESALFAGPYLAMNLFCSHRALGISLLLTVRSLIPILAASIVAGACAYVLGAAWSTDFWQALAWKIIVFFAIYVPIVLFTVRPFPFAAVERLLNKVTTKKEAL
ncbi:oligosaccharide flippase family protein [Variovorax beijingensis]|nr:oligosaccharide flippase family protein [Variovorax beijingensis]